MMIRLGSFELSALLRFICFLQVLVVDLGLNSIACSACVYGSVQASSKRIRRRHFLHQQAVGKAPPTRVLSDRKTGEYDTYRYRFNKSILLIMFGVTRCCLAVISTFSNDF